MDFENRPYIQIKNQINAPYQRCNIQLSQPLPVALNNSHQFNPFSDNFNQLGIKKPNNQSSSKHGFLKIKLKKEDNEINSFFKRKANFVGSHYLDSLQNKDYYPIARKSVILHEGFDLSQRISTYQRKPNPFNFLHDKFYKIQKILDQTLEILPSRPNDFASQFGINVRTESQDRFLYVLYTLNYDVQISSHYLFNRISRLPPPKDPQISIMKLRSKQLLPPENPFLKVSPTDLISSTTSGQENNLPGQTQFEISSEITSSRSRRSSNLSFHDFDNLAQSSTSGPKKDNETGNNSQPSSPPQPKTTEDSFSYIENIADIIDFRLTMEAMEDSKKQVLSVTKPISCRRSNKPLMSNKPNDQGFFSVYEKEKLSSESYLRTDILSYIGLRIRKKQRQASSDFQKLEIGWSDNRIPMRRMILSNQDMFFERKKVGNATGGKSGTSSSVSSFKSHSIQMSQSSTAQMSMTNPTSGSSATAAVAWAKEEGSDPFRMTLFKDQSLVSSISQTSFVKKGDNDNDNLNFSDVDKESESQDSFF